jgi:hypothetical protein
MSNRRSAAWYFHLPGAVYAYGPARFATPLTERQARAAVRRVWGFTRLLRGTEFWPTEV